MIIELDGGYHLDRKEYDEERSLYLNSMGYKVIRFWNDDIFNDTEAVLNVILKACNK